MAFWNRWSSETQGTPEDPIDCWARAKQHTYILICIQLKINWKLTCCIYLNAAFHHHSTQIQAFTNILVLKSFCSKNAKEQQKKRDNIYSTICKTDTRTKQYKTSQQQYTTDSLENRKNLVINSQLILHQRSRWDRQNCSRTQYLQPSTIISSVFKNLMNRSGKRSLNRKTKETAVFDVAPTCSTIHFG